MSTMAPTFPEPRQAVLHGTADFGQVLATVCRGLGLLVSNGHLIDAGYVT